MYVHNVIFIPKPGVEGKCRCLLIKEKKNIFKVKPALWDFFLFIGKCPLHSGPCLTRSHNSDLCILHRVFKSGVCGSIPALAHQ